MRFALGYALIAILSLPAYAQEAGLAKPNLVLQQIVEGLPADAKQAVRVLTATFKPGDKTVYHSHRFPVTVYVLEGAFTLDLKVVQCGRHSGGSGILTVVEFRRSGR